MIFVSSSCVKENNIAEVIRRLVQKGIQNIELSGGTDYYDEIEHDLKMLKKNCHLQYACHAYFPPPKVPFVVNLASCNDRIYRQSIEHYERCIEIMKRLDCKTLSIHAGFLVEISENEVGKKLSGSIVYDELEAYDRFCNAFCHISELCAACDMELFLENNVLNAENYRQFAYHNYMMMTDCESIMKMKERMDFNLLLDLGHLHVSANTLGLDYAKECNQLKEYVRWLHISENNGIYDEHKPLKEDSEILKEFYKLYHSDLNVTLETVGEIEDIVQSMTLIQDVRV